ncbi:phospholipase A2 inhibitor 1-like isoform X2 [Ambystoma mexicanum]|uniref:phospholipase A2 inhibitor 1-like isoform X2 n=1 Tax=Ambystoma mexicanum TaxID=8296 RepID=UPI0037E9602D
MRVFLTAMAILFAVITEGNSLICEQCYNINAESCSGVFAPCPANVTHCVKRLEKNKDGPYEIQLAYKGCLDPSKQPTCGKEVVFRGADMLLWIKRECCDSDSCNSQDIQALPILQTPNGFKCPECSTEESATGCTAVKDVICVGNENQCANFTGNAERPDLPILQTPNGFKCPECSTEESATGCTAVKDVICVGNENQCANFTGNAERPGDVARAYSLRMCATKDACDVGILSMEGIKAFQYDFKCSDAIKV